MISPGRLGARRQAVLYPQQLMIPHNDPEFLFSDQKKFDILSCSVSGESKLIKVFFCDSHSHLVYF